MPRVLGVDYGHKRTGLALSDELANVALPMGHIAGGAEHVIAEIIRIAAERGIGRIVVGVPRRLDGTNSEQTERTLNFISTLQKQTPLPVERWDEWLTSVQAGRVLIEGDVRRRDRKEKVDQLAAQLLLQSYLDAHAERLKDEG